MLNVVALMGRLVADPELRHTPQGISVTTFTIAVDRSFVRQGEQRQADFIDIVCWRATADFVCRYFQKGSLIAVNGSIQTRRYQDRNGNNRTAFEIVADNVHFAGSKNGGNGGGNDYAPHREYSSAPAPAPQQPAAPASYAVGSNDDFAVIDDDGDLPF